MDSLRQHVVALLRGGQAYDSFDSVVDEFRHEERWVVPPGAERSAWQIVEHMQRALRDILDFCQNESGTYIERDWPADYWPTSSSPIKGAWEDTINAYKVDLAEMEALVQDDSRDLFKQFPWGEGQTLLREALLAADHASHHLGQLIELKRWIDATPMPKR
ncbi:MAG: DinB family protein [Fimbriimonadales bacterium]